ncbi:BspA family leucine-rich repeat surface protein [Xylocopilactobacillus apicola]|uniref:BspA family leucine-rich repeat surface protein n=1 Tax=Xylocopilactobacillus apicola TaxID=2932184 RepID=A0AAU9D786_9LACO|nr:BspA family leucine-rich repeat surface protein [Xylocopilactobacillus apicola]BDR59739.1 hypothetical protein XA3_21800 [Xylocopilactobacillus apicola]
MILLLVFLGKQSSIFRSKAEDANTITKLAQVQTNLNNQLTSNYSFAPSLASNSQVTSTNDNSRINTNTFQFYPNDNGEISGEIKYTYAGITSDGQVLDVVLKFSAQNATKITIAPIGQVTLSGKMAQSQLKLQFFLHGTKTPVALDGHFTIDQLTPNEEFGLKLNQIKQIYSRSDSLVQTISGQDYTVFKVNEENINNQFTVIYDQQSELDYSLNNAGSEDSKINLSSASLVDISLPEAKMAGIDQSIAPSLDHAAEVKPLYLIQQNIVSKDAGYLGWNQIDDELDPIWVVNPKDIEITNELQQDVTTLFQVMIKGHHLTIDATSNALKSADYYGHTYSFLIKGRPNYELAAKSEQDYVKLGAVNSAEITLKTSTDTISQTTNSATNQATFSIPKITLDQTTIYQGMKEFSGETNEPRDLDLKITYTDYDGKIHEQEPLDITYNDSLSQGELVNFSTDQNQKWKATIPTDLNAQAAPVKVTIGDQSGYRKDYMLRDGTWWDYNSTTKVLTIHPHELNFDVDKQPHVGTDLNGTFWPWTYGSRATADKPYYAEKIVIEPGVTAKDNLEMLFYSMPYVKSIEGLENLDTSSVTSMYCIFHTLGTYSGGLDLNLSNLNTSNVTDFRSMFYNCGATTLDLSHLDTSNGTDMSSMFGASKATTLDVTPLNTSKVTKMHSMFRDCKATTIDLSNLDTSQVTDMSYMFFGSTSLTSLDLSHFNTSKVTAMTYMFSQVNLSALDLSNFDTGNVTNMSGMFSSCKQLTSLNLDNFNTSNVTTMVSMFLDCAKLQDFDFLTNLDTHNVTSMYSMFNGCKLLDGVDFSTLPKFNTSKVLLMNFMFANSGISSKTKIGSFDTSSVQGMDYMFNNCLKLDTIDVGSWNTSQVTSVFYMFAGCTALTTLDVSDWVTSNITKASYMFYNCNKLTHLDVSNWNTGKINTMESMFVYCRSLNNLDVSKWNTGSVTTMQGMFYGCTNINNLDVALWDTAKVTTMMSMFNSCTSLTNLNSDNWNVTSVQTMQDMFRSCTALTKVGATGWVPMKVTNMNGMFFGCTALSEINLSSWDVGNVLDMGNMFNNCSSLTNLDSLQNWNVSKVKTFGGMFSRCGIITLDLRNWNTISVTYISSMFFNCASLTNLNVSTWTTSNITEMTSAFQNCYSLTSLDVHNWDVSKVTGFRGLFSYCSSLTELDLSNWNSISSKSTYGMFQGCSSLTNLNISNLKTSNVTDMSYMFSGCRSLSNLDVSDFDTSKVIQTTSMFQNCASLLSLDLNGWDTSSLGSIISAMTYGNMKDMFNGCTSLATLDLSTFDTSKLNAVQGNGNTPLSLMMNSFKDTPNLWKIVLGPNAKFPSSTLYQSIGIKNPILGTKIYDPLNPTGNYYATDSLWQEVGTGSDHGPNGATKTAEDIIKDSQLTRTQPTTYVWYQVGKLGFTVSPQVDLGTHKSPVNNKEFQSELQSLDITDSRNLRDGKQWQINVSASDLTKSDDPTKKVSGNPLYIKSDVGVYQLSATATNVYTGTSVGVGFQDEWTKDWNLMFKAPASSIPAEGTYQGQIIFTLVDTTP